MALNVGSRLGHYDVTALIGEGGMGQVYQATDTKLNRQVALKILPEAFATDPDRLARFQREAQVLASLNHPNIAQIHGLEESEGTRALVLELVEGPTLADRIAKGPVPADEALPIAKQIAAALEAAHEAGVIHRDLKPANIKVRDDGTVKVLDFGLAKALDTTLEGDPSQSPTLTAAATQMGVIMGTAAYMSPEQASGETTDKRSDIWSFGVVLFEMLTGQRLFTGKTVSHVLGAVLQVEPKWDALPVPTPQPLRKLLRRCLEKDRKRRLRDIGDALIDLDEPPTAEPIDQTAVTPAQPAVWRPALSLALGSVIVCSLITGLAVWTMIRPDAVPGDLIRFTIAPPDTAPLDLPGNYPNLVISPDGTQIIYESDVPSGPEGNLHRRPIDELIGAPLRGGENGAGPFVSPDGQWVGFIDSSGRTLQKVSIFGGPPVTLAEAPNLVLGASWGTDDQIILGTFNAGLFRVSGGGGEPEALTTLDTEQGDAHHTWPFVIPDREAVVFVIATGAPRSTGQLAVLNLATDEVTRLGIAGVSPHYVSTGHLVYASEDGSVRGVPFDANALEVTGNPVPLIDGVPVKLSGAADFSISDNGRLVYAVGSDGIIAERSLVWVDREGREEAVDAEPGRYQGLRVAPDGERAAVVVVDGDDNTDVVIYDLTRDIPTRFTFDPASDSFPVWSPDGERVVFASTREGTYNLFWKAADGTGETEQLTTGTATAQYSSSWSRDGTALFFAEIDPQKGTGLDIGVLAMDDERALETLIETEFADAFPEISPDGRWMAYHSTESGQFEIYVRPFPNVDTGRWQVSRGGGRKPVWAPDGRELFYRRPDDLAMMVAPIETEPTFRPGNSEVLFEATDFPVVTGPRRFDIAPDGQRFLMIKEGRTTLEDAAPPQINVVLNWSEELKRLVPVP